MESEDYFAGIDEAGRGPVLGPMVFSLCIIKNKNRSFLNSLNPKDSKQTSIHNREKLYKKMKNSNKINYLINIISPQKISYLMNREIKINLNTISQTATIELIKICLENKLRLKEVYIDTVGPSVNYQKMLSKRYAPIKFIVAEKADSIFPIVSAASIFAKVERDRIIKNWEFDPNFKIVSKLGSGYPNDPKTKIFIKNNCDYIYGYPPIVRTSWKTSIRIMEIQTLKIKWKKKENKKRKFRDIRLCFNTENKNNKDDDLILVNDF